MYKDALTTFKNSDLTSAGRSLSKHPEIIGSTKQNLRNTLDKINQKFAKPAREEADAHRGAAYYGDLQQIFCWQYERQIKNDTTI